MRVTTSTRTAICLVTIFFLFIEWLLIEAMRLPYRPPHDMNTLLGQEVFTIPYIMGFIACGWLLLAITVSLKCLFTWQDFIAFTLLFLLLATAFGLLIAYPFWSVTPFKHLLSYMQK
ncbi:MAG: hypothetical protein HQ518_13535 [Rhodopirellula sp.]|nr:hypothetical protein [Rhodopirellula sp.]